MRRAIFITFSASLLFSALLALGLLALLGPAIALGHYPNATTKSSSVHLATGALVAQDSSYETNDSILSVAAWYVWHYHMEPDHEVLVQRQCIQLSKVNRLRALRQSVRVSICPHNGGTEVLFNQLVYLRP